MNFVCVPTKEYKKHEKFVEEISQNRFCNDIRLENIKEIPKVKPVYTWKLDETNIINTCVDFYKLMHADECSTKDYIKPTKPYWKDRDLHKANIRETIQKSIRELMSPIQYMEKQNDLRPFSQ